MNKNIKKIYRYTIKPILNVITLRFLRRRITHCFICLITYLKNKKLIQSIENNLPPATVLIFQHRFFDENGEKCFNGGAERYIKDLSDILHELHFNPVLVQVGGENIWYKQLNNLLVIGLPNKRGLNCYSKQIALFKKYKFAIYSGAYKFSKVLLHPNILISHGITWDAPKSAKCSYKLFENVNNFVSVDTNTISWLRTTFINEFSNKRVVYIPNYVDTTVYMGESKLIDKDKSQKKRIKIIFPRRASAERGYWLMSSVLPSILEKYKNVDFDFIGFAHENEIVKDIEKLVQMFSGRVNHHVVEPDEMPKFYQQADISIIPTLYSEGTSLSCLEAQACGNVVIATNIGGLPNLIIDGYNGILINPNPQELMDALDRVLSDIEFREYLSKNAINVAKSFDKQIWNSRWKKIFKEITN
ncbi:MAG: glycosyltransferase family 4 protein [Rickettsiales bacterium]|nr:glycosyltransferase family 4 protein [Rickettsiales bacterium]